MRLPTLRRAGMVATVGSNSASLIATTAITSMLGAAYWWLAARRFPAPAVGGAGAAVSAMTLLGVVATVGLTTAIIPKLQDRSAGRAAALIATALTLVGALGVLLGAIWQAVAGHVGADLALSGLGPATILLFGAGVGATAVTQVLDQALIGLLRSDLQLLRNVVFAASKLLAVALVATLPESARGAGAIYATWLAGQVASLLLLAAVVLLTVGASAFVAPRLSSLRGVRVSAVSHHVFNLVLSAPSWILPLIATTAISATADAYFYTAWTMAGLVFAGPMALTMVLFAFGERRAGLRGPLILTLVLSLIWSLACLGGCALFASPVLHLYGSAYGREATPVLMVLCLAVFAQVVKLHYIAVVRLRGRLTIPILLFLGFAGLELALAVLGAERDGIRGLAEGWVVAISVEALAVAAPVVGALLGRAGSPAGQELAVRGADPEPL